VLANPIGFAPGFVLPFGSSQLYFLPGVPAELRAIFAAEVSPRLRVQLPTGRAIQRTAVRVFGLGESEVNQRLSDLLSSPQPSASDPTRTSQHFQSTLHYRIAFPEILVTFITAGATQQAIAQEQARLLQGLRDRLGDAAYSYSHLEDGGDGLPVLVGETLRARRATVATAESCTGGLIGASLTSVPGSSDYFIGGVISYANEVKQQQLGVSPQTLAAHGAVSRACVEEMARGVRQLLGTTYGVAVSGVAGPGGGSPEKPVGTVFFAVATPEGCLTDQILWPGEREPLRQLATAYALRLLLKAVLA
jgi:nicotinamide-nucleotide amidase